MRTSHFSLVEIIVVTVIILAIAALAGGRVGIPPTAMTLERTVHELELLFERGRHLANLRGIPIKLIYAPEDRIFRIALTGMDTPADGNMAWLNARNQTFTIPQGMTLKFGPGGEDPRGEYHIGLDGGGTGPEMTLQLNDRKINLKISPLTGLLLRRGIPSIKVAL